MESIRIYGVKESQNENSGEVVCDIMKEKLGIELCPGDINKVHRLNQVNPAVNKPRAIIVKFFSHAIKRRCVLNRKKLKGTGIVIAEDLTRVNSGVLNRARNHDCVESTWSVEGKLFAKLRDGTRDDWLRTKTLRTL